ncbi:MAG: HAMP domain-containing sensor histidine kinase [Anaerolineae bacterium]
MENTKSIKLDAWQKTSTQLIESNRADLANRYHQVLRETLFSNRTTMRPSMIKSIASDEIDALNRFLCQSLSSITEHGVQLYETGLGEQAVLRLGQATRQFFLTHLDDGQVAPTLEAIDAYQESVIQGYIQTQEKTILKEQELIRSAFQTAVSRYTIEIKEIEAIAQKATEANEFKTQFIARMGHELRTPLGAMMGMAEMLQEGVYGPLTPEQKDLTQRIINNAVVLKQIFTELLDQSQIESGQLQLKAEKISPQILIETVYSNYLPLALQKGLAMQVKAHANLPRTIIGDETRIEQVVSNLVVNAIKFTETGSIVIRAYKADAAHWEVEVKDTGIGIAQEHLTYIFEPFRQTDETAGRKHSGVGLGLAIVQQLVTAMKGTIDVKSKLGQGSVFTVNLPLQLAQ